MPHVNILWVFGLEVTPLSRLPTGCGAQEVCSPDHRRNINNPQHMSRSGSRSPPPTLHRIHQRPGHMLCRPCRPSTPSLVHLQSALVLPNTFVYRMNLRLASEFHSRIGFAAWICLGWRPHIHQRGQLTSVTPNLGHLPQKTHKTQANSDKEPHPGYHCGHKSGTSSSLHRLFLTFSLFSLKYMSK